MPHWVKDEKVGYKMINARANEDAVELHDRMPVIIAIAGFDLWLDRRVECSG